MKKKAIIAVVSVVICVIIIIILVICLHSGYKSIYSILYFFKTLCFKHYNPIQNQEKFYGI